MDELKEFFAANATIETNPVVWLNKGAERTCARILPEHLPADFRIALLESRLAALHTRARAAIERGRSDLIESILADFANDLRAGYQRAFPSLKEMTPADEVKRVAATGQFEKLAWHKEPWILAQVLEQSERIEKIDFREITTSKRTITRRDPAFDAPRPISQSREHWYSQCCTPESIVDDMEAAAKREIEIAQRAFHRQAGPHAGEATVVRR